jgi:hypothetical protein
LGNWRRLSLTTHRIGSSASRAGSVLAIALAMSAVSCAAKPVTLGQTQIGQGKLYQSGSVTYDRFFQDTHAMQLDVMRADEDEAQARAPLDRVLDSRGASMEKLYDLVVARAKKEETQLLYVAVTGLDPNKEKEKEKEKDNKDPVESGETPKEGAKEGAKEAPPHDAKEPPRKLAVAVAPLDPASFPADQKPFLKALSETVRAEAEIVDRFGPIAVKASQLAAYSDELVDGVDKEFSARKQRKEVNQELGAAKLILGATEERARNVAIRARTFLTGLTEALKPPPEAPPPPPPVPLDKPVTKSARPRRGTGGGASTGAATKPVKPSGAETAPAPAPAPAKPAKPKPSEDFNP